MAAQARASLRRGDQRRGVMCSNGGSACGIFHGDERSTTDSRYFYRQLQWRSQYHHLRQQYRAERRAASSWQRFQRRFKNRYGGVDTCLLCQCRIGHDCQCSIGDGLAKGGNGGDADGFDSGGGGGGMGADGALYVRAGTNVTVDLVSFAAMVAHCQDKMAARRLTTRGLRAGARTEVPAAGTLQSTRSMAACRISMASHCRCRRFRAPTVQLRLTRPPHEHFRRGDRLFVSNVALLASRHSRLRECSACDIPAIGLVGTSAGARQPHQQCVQAWRACSERRNSPPSP